MTTGHKLLIGAGTIVIVGMLLIAAFALGIYVGEHGWTRAGLTLQGPGAPDRPPPQPGGASAPENPLPLPGGGRRPDITGRIREVFDGTLMLATPDGPRIVELDEQTRVETPNGDALSVSDLERGQNVAVFGYRSGDGQVLIAELIVLLPQPEQPSASPPGQPSPQRP